MFIDLVLYADDVQMVHNLVVWLIVQDGRRAIIDMATQVKFDTFPGWRTVGPKIFRHPES